jgi:hypothetical protein
MDQFYVLILVAVTSLISGIIGAGLTARYQIRLEEKKWQINRQDALDKEKRLAVAELCRRLVELIQEAGSLTWYAKNHPARIRLTDIKKYEKASNLLLPQIMSLLVVVSTLDGTFYKSMNILVQKAYEIDLVVSRGIIVLSESRIDGLAAMAQCHPKVKAFWIDMNKVMADSFSSQDE